MVWFRLATRVFLGPGQMGLGSMENFITPVILEPHQLILTLQKERLLKRIENIRSHRNMYIMFIAVALFTAAQSGNNPSVHGYINDEWIHKIWFNHTQEYCSAKKKK